MSRTFWLCQCACAWTYATNGRDAWQSKIAACVAFVSLSVELWREIKADWRKP